MSIRIQGGKYDGIALSKESDAAFSSTGLVHDIDLVSLEVTPPAPQRHGKLARVRNDLEDVTVNEIMNIYRRCMIKVAVHRGLHASCVMEPHEFPTENIVSRSDDALSLEPIRQIPNSGRRSKLNY